MIVKFWTFSKRENSTAQPTAEATSYNCILKDSTTITNPVIQLGLGATENPSTFNYAEIADFHRYYFVSDWTANGNIWEASLVCDVLATYKTYIGASEQYVLRSASSYDGSITDGLYPAKPTPTLTTTTGTNPWAQTLSAGKFVVGVINKDASGSGGVSYYALAPDDMQALNDKMLSDLDLFGDDWGDFSDDFVRANLNPSQYLKSVMWFPFDFATLTTIKNHLELGWWDLDGIYNEPMTAGGFIQLNTITLSIPKHPQATTKGAFVNAAPYSRYTLFIPPFGSIPIDANAISGYSNLYLLITVDLFTGIGQLQISPSNDFDNVIGTYTTQIGVTMSVSQISQNYLATAGSIIGTVGAIAGGSVVGAAHGILSTIDNLFPQAQSAGQIGNTAAYKLAPKLFGEFYHIVSDDITHRGRPLMADRVINTLSGYVICADGDISLPSTQEENTRVKKYLEGGFFYE